LNSLFSEPQYQQIVSQFFGGNVASDPINIFRKDELANNAVFLHQDIAYLPGNFEKYSLFFCLTDVHPENGGLAFYPGTHNFGLLGDAGALKHALPSDYPKLAPICSAGDLVIMHSGIWHYSEKATKDMPRIYLESKICSADDPAAETIVCGRRTNAWSIKYAHDDLFEDSRTQRLRNLYEKIGKS
jgi:ectoine hydroxylase-related dioxygenase (phytanoyl-CoA dioxygenase family)